MNTQLVFPLDICTKRFTAYAAIGHWSSSCHNIMRITRELDNEFLIHCYTVYIIDTWSMLIINMPTLMYICCHESITLFSQDKHVF